MGGAGSLNENQPFSIHNVSVRQKHARNIERLFCIGRGLVARGQCPLAPANSAGRLLWGSRLQAIPQKYTLVAILTRIPDSICGLFEGRSSRMRISRFFPNTTVLPPRTSPCGNSCVGCKKVQKARRGTPFLKQTTARSWDIPHYFLFALHMADALWSLPNRNTPSFAKSFDPQRSAALSRAGG